jgi:hypothetical protein
MFFASKTFHETVMKNFSQQDETWAEFSSLHAGICPHILVPVYQQNGLCYS